MATAIDAGDVWLATQRHRLRVVASHGFDVVGQPVLAIHAEAEAGDRDSDLRRRDVAVLQLRVFENAQDVARQEAALRCLVLDARPRCADNGELGRDEQCVRQSSSRMIAIGDEQSRS